MKQIRERLFPILLIENGRLIKTSNFKNPRYLGDPLNALRIFNEKCADEIIIIDKSKDSINMNLLDRMVSEAFMPLSYVGNIRSMEDFEKVFNLGIEKAGVCGLAFDDPDLLNLAAGKWGASSVFLVMNVIKKGKILNLIRNNKIIGTSESHFEFFSKLNIGEIVIQDIAREGTLNGLDADILIHVKDHFNVPIVISGGANSIESSVDFINDNNISGVAAGSLFSFYGNRNAVLINYDYE